MWNTFLLLVLWPIAVFSAAVPPVLQGFPPDNGSFTWDGKVSFYGCDGPSGAYAYMLISSRFINFLCLTTYPTRNSEEISKSTARFGRIPSSTAPMGTITTLHPTS